MMGRQSRLWRKLGATAPVFEAASTELATVTDQWITGATITHGTGAPVGLSVTTAELGVIGNLPAAPNYADLTIGLTDYGADLVAGMIGADPSYATPARGRFTGRLVGLDVDDRGDTRRAAWTTRVTASTWTSVISDLGKPATASNLMPVSDLYAALLTGDKLPGATNYTAAITSSTEPTLRYINPTDIPASTITGTLMADIGVMLRPTRGQLAYEAYGTDPRILAAAIIASDPTRPALLRRQCEAPVTWSIPVTVPLGAAYNYYEPGGTKVSGLVLPDGTGTAQWPAVDVLDLTDLVIDADGFSIDRVMTARVRRSSPTRYRLDTLRVDLLRLLSSDDPVDHATAGMLLRLDVGDPLKLEYDWPDDVAGIVFASRITERVTPDGWTLDLDVTTFEQVTGEASPTVSGGTWDTAWPDSTTWDTVPDYQTWDTI